MADPVALLDQRPAVELPDRENRSWQARRCKRDFERVPFPSAAASIMVAVALRHHAMSRILKLSIEGMHCGGCVTRLSNTLRRLEGVELRQAEVGAAEIAFDEQRISKEDIAAAIERIGFQVIGANE